MPRRQPTTVASNAEYNVSPIDPSTDESCSVWSRVPPSDPNSILKMGMPINSRMISPSNANTKVMPVRTLFFVGTSVFVFIACH